MSKSIKNKIISMLCLIVLMTFAVNYINGIILERQRNHLQVERDIGKSYTRSQTLLGPVLVVPYQEEYTVSVYDHTENGKAVNVTKTQYKEGKAYFLPEEIKLAGNFGHEYKKRGIYQALMYEMGSTMNGYFNVPAGFGIKAEHKNGKLHFKAAYLALGISDTRGIIGKPDVTFNTQPYKFTQGTNVSSLGNGIHANLGKLASTHPAMFSFSLKMNLRGMKDFYFIPTAETNKLTMQSAWPHPKFSGSFLPTNKSISKKGFKGEWIVSALSSNNQSMLMAALNNDEFANQSPSSYLQKLSLGFIEPINVYSQSDRATKYGLLFIGLTFVGFFLYEVLKQLRIHPAQYALVGLSMATFYLLLVSFAELFGFATAYLSASTACVLLLGFYLTYVLKSTTHGLLFSSFLASLYGALYLILESEDNALVMGSVLIFGLLASIMIITRNVDWYALSPAESAANTSNNDPSSN